MKLGEANSAQELDIEKAICLIADWSDRPLTYERINGGITNVNWKIQLNDTRTNFFMKIPGANSEVFIDRALAREATQKASAAGVAPKVLYYIPEQDVEVHEFLEGFRSCTSGDLLDLIIRKNVIEAYRHIHATQTLSQTITGFDLVRRRLKAARTHRALLPRDLEAMLAHVAMAEKAIVASGMTLCACYNDAYVTNYMVDLNNNIKIIDWEYASNNDPYWDLAAFSFENFLLGKKEIGEIIEIHDGKSTKEIEARIIAYAAIAAVMWGIWAALQAQISPISFDFGKYSKLLFLRARDAFSRPEWERALKRI